MTEQVNDAKAAINALLEREQREAKADISTVLPPRTNGLKRWTDSHPLTPMICRTETGEDWVFSPEIRSLGSAVLYHCNERGYEVVPFSATFVISPSWTTTQRNRYATIRRAITRAAKSAECEFEGFQITEISNKDRTEHLHWMGWLNPLRLPELKKALKTFGGFKANSSQHLSLIHI